MNDQPRSDATDEHLTAAGLTEAQVPGPAEAARPLADRAGRFELEAEIGRGGMGAVYRARDPEMGRALAVKVLLERHRDNPVLTRRFREEAQITGQLQHPGVPSAHEVGALPDGRPFFAMKLVKGRTLHDLLQERPEPTHDLTHFLGVFLQVSQAVAYAHSKGVIHRDLKPQNVMVGAFGEVQVMDWGVAKILTGPPSQGPQPPEGAPTATVTTQVETQRTGLPNPATRLGSPLGTYAYMPPEQASTGLVGPVDRRSDVFGLGAILCEVLTGRPPYTGDTEEEVRRKATQADLGEALGRLAAAGGDDELARLVRSCLDRDVGRRPADGGAVAQAVAAYLAGVQEKLRLAEIGRAAAQVRATEERRRRRMTLALAATVVLALAGAAAIGLWVQADRAARAADRDHQRDQAENRLGLEVHDTEVARDAGRLPEAAEAARRALALAADDRVRPEVADRARGLAGKVLDQAAAAERDRILLARLPDIRATVEGADNRTEGLPAGAAEASADEKYAQAFREWGLDVGSTPTAEAAAKIKSRPANLQSEVRAALDDWANPLVETRMALHLWANPPGQREGVNRRPVVDLLEAIDPDDRRKELRALLSDDRLRPEWIAGELSVALMPLGELAGLAPGTLRARLRQLAETADPGRDPVPGLLLLARALQAAGDADRAERLLLAAARARSSEAALWDALGHLARDRRPPRWDKATEYFQTLRALRPDQGLALASALRGAGRLAEAEVVLRDLLRQRPDNRYFLMNLGTVLKRLGRTQEVEAMAREAIRRRPEDPLWHLNLGIYLFNQERYRESEAACRDSIRLKTDFPEAHNMLGHALFHQSRYPESEAAFREATRLKPDWPEPHGNLGHALLNQDRYGEAEAAFREAVRLDPGDPEGHNNLALALARQGRWKEVEAASREALGLRPAFPDARYNLAVALARQRRWAEAEAEYRETIRLKPGFAEAHYSLGNTLVSQGRHQEAEAAFREAARLNPSWLDAHVNLGNALLNQNRPRDAEAAAREAVRLRPDLPQAHNCLARSLRAQGRFAEALAAFRRSHELGLIRPDWRYPSADWVREAERLADLEARLPAVLRGDDSPAAGDLTLQVEVCRTKGFRAAAVRFAADAFAAEPRLVERPGGPRSTSARSAARAAAGQGEDAARLPAKAKAALRRQSLDWLRAELAGWAALAADEKSRPQLRQALRQWQETPDLSGVRDPAALAQLPEAERAAWRRLWADAAELLRRAEAGP